MKPPPPPAAAPAALVAPMNLPPLDSQICLMAASTGRSGGRGLLDRLARLSALSCPSSSGSDVSLLPCTKRLVRLVRPPSAGGSAATWFSETSRVSRVVSRTASGRAVMRFWPTTILTSDSHEASSTGSSSKALLEARISSSATQLPMLAGSDAILLSLMLRERSAVREPSDGSAVSEFLASWISLRAPRLSSEGMAVSLFQKSARRLSLVRPSSGGMGLPVLPSWLDATLSISRLCRTPTPSGSSSSLLLKRLSSRSDCSLPMPGGRRSMSFL
mmetsp:Transcript_81971/g.220134  ORF Transcript_81971/g.220134 Transcript_81971/m.220134 type:complete len:274 (+) Transcript_81971:416-1237(+)